MTNIERAKQVRAAMMLTADTYTDDQAAKIPSLYPVWITGEAVKPGDRRYYEPAGKLYKVRDGQGHTTQADWTPEVTPAMWAVIDVAHAGTLDDPIPASRGMDYIYGKHYLDPEDGKTYLCTRQGATESETINLQYLPHELTGQYFEEVAV